VCIDKIFRVAFRYDGNIDRDRLFRRFPWSGSLKRESRCDGGCAVRIEHIDAPKGKVGRARREEFPPV